MATVPSDTSKRRTRRQFSDEFKEQAVRLVLDEGKSIAAVARELDLESARFSLANAITTITHQGFQRLVSGERPWLCAASRERTFEVMPV